MSGLREAQWASDGEILNLDRHIFLSHRNPNEVRSLKYLRIEQSPQLFHQGIQFLESCTCSSGYIYKDVVQPFILSSWPGLKDFTSVYLHRPLADIAYSVLKQGWDWPAHAITRNDAEKNDIIQGLITAEQVLRKIPAKRIEFEDLVNDASTLQRTLSEYQLTPIDYLTSDFLQKRDMVLQTRETSEYKELEAWIKTIINEG